MFTVLHNNIEYPINYIRSANYQMAVNDIPELSMIVINGGNNPAYPYLNEEAVILVDGHEWRIKAESEVANYKNVTALHVLFDLIDMPFNQLLNGTYTPRNLLATILSGTGFTLDLDESGLASVLLKDFGRKSPWKLLKEATEMLHAEFTVLPGRVIQVRKQLSNDKGQQFRYGYNLKNITKKTDSSDVVTHVIINYGEDYSQTAEFESPTAGNYDRAHYGDIINDERIEDRETARKRAEREFKDIDLSYEIDVARLGGNYELGETVHTIYEPFNDLSITTRIMQTKHEWNGEEFDLTEVTVGNYVFKTADEIIQDQFDKSIDETKEKIDETKEVINKNVTLKFQETDTKIRDQYTTITSEYSSAISISARELRSEFNEKVTTINTAINAQYSKITEEYNSKITQTAREIRTDVDAKITKVGENITEVREYASSISQTAEQIRVDVNAKHTTVTGELTTIKRDVSTVTQTASEINSRVNSHTTEIGGLGTRISSAASEIKQTAEAVSSKVSQTDFNGDAIVSLINQTAYGVSISAQKINLYGSVIVDGSISGATNISVSSDIQLGRGLYFSDMTALTTGGGNLTLAAYSNINYQASTHYFNGNVNFQNASVTGLSVSSVNGYTMAYSTSGGKKYMTFRQNGSYLGQVELT